MVGSVGFVTRTTGRSPAFAEENTRTCRARSMVYGGSYYSKGTAVPHGGHHGVVASVYRGPRKPAHRFMNVSATPWRFDIVGRRASEQMPRRRG